ncbi:High mobility group box domain containing protein [Cryptosporidium meleagridis]
MCTHDDRRVYMWLKFTGRSLWGHFYASKFK